MFVGRSTERRGHERDLVGAGLHAGVGQQPSPPPPPRRRRQAGRQADRQADSHVLQAGRQNRQAGRHVLWAGRHKRQTGRQLRAVGRKTSQEAGSRVLSAGIQDRQAGSHVQEVKNGRQAVTCFRQTSQDRQTDSAMCSVQGSPLRATWPHGRVPPAQPWSSPPCPAWATACWPCTKW